MSVFTIADLHLPFSNNHPMDVFGARWLHYTDKIQKNWQSLVTPADTVILPGDISWSMALSDAKADFLWLDALPGKKLIGKGNHDFWWTTAAKLGRQFEEWGVSTISLLYNNAYVVEDFIVCGTRGWFFEEEQQKTVGTVDFNKIKNRELQRLELSLKAARALKSGEHADKEILVFLHFPPVFGEFTCHDTLALLARYGVRRCFFGHIHGCYDMPQTVVSDGIALSLISSDFLNFTPFLLRA